MAIISEYWIDSLFAISRRYLKLKLEPDVCQYGETPLLTIEKIARYARITERDCISELGSGTGRYAFWLAHSMGCRVVGIEQIPNFVDFANQLIVKDDVLAETISFIRDNFLLPISVRRRRSFATARRWMTIKSSRSF